MRHSASRARRAFTLVEILVAIVVLGIVGGSLVKLIITQSRFTERQMAGRNARTVSRNAMNIMLTDFRMVQDQGGLLAAGRGPTVTTDPLHPIVYDSVTVNVPIAFGLYCGQSGGSAVVSLLPVDDAMSSLAYEGGVAIRDSVSELYTYKPADPPVAFNSIQTLSPSALNVCNSAVLGGPAITQVTQANQDGTTDIGKIAKLNTGPPSPNNPGWPAFLYQTVTYRFEPSKAFTGRMGLFRKVRTGLGNDPVADFKTDEIIAPFDTAAGFRYYVLNEDTAQVAPPTDLTKVRGLQLYLAGSSPRVPEGENAAQSALVTGVFFKNRRDP
jgi:prepilin-type N-terminal cleavage/methylation domain-containing protein